MSALLPPAPGGSGVPNYPDIKSLAPIWGHMRVWEGDGWQRESMSWKDGVYLAANLVGPIEYVISGAEAQDFLSRLSINDVWKWPIGRSKHLVMLDDQGLIASHALTVRDGEARFRMLAGPPWPLFQVKRLNLDVTIEVNEIFILQVAGPKSAEVLEKLFGGGIRDLAFLAAEPVTVPGVDGEAEIELSRISMSGNLGYEVRGPLAAGPAVYDAVYRAGLPLGIVRLGWRTYAVNHTEGGFPQSGVTWLASMLLDPAVQRSSVGALLAAEYTGSIDPADTRARTRTPHEVNWEWMGKSNHEFIGREAFDAESAAPRRKTVILRWNPDDVTDIFASYLRPGEPYKFIEFPVSPQQPAGGHADLVTHEGVAVGVSSAVVYSYYYRELISQATVGLEHSDIGAELVVHWGDHGGRIKQVRAVVGPFPYLDLPRNADSDVSAS
ncbi:aminomethyltransferase [Microbacterium sp. 1.5R]|uniref:aminomethyltransferase family protein n=1 Tax=Microbacterium sp. 1.5R TaxID=1916917 RepID=UPI0009096243|nr:aminomethyltransferase family protein [Microbacterium sp. 1.5R]APH46046.1 aminomethyltransferase [Microbacterium sp. 1.5R]